MAAGQGKTKAPEDLSHSPAALAYRKRLERMSDDDRTIERAVKADQMATFQARRRVKATDLYIVAGVEERGRMLSQETERVMKERHIQGRTADDVRARIGLPIGSPKMRGRKPRASEGNTENTNTHTFQYRLSNFNGKEPSTERETQIQGQTAEYAKLPTSLALSQPATADGRPVNLQESSAIAPLVIREPSASDMAPHPPTPLSIAHPSPVFHGNDELLDLQHRLAQINARKYALERDLEARKRMREERRATMMKQRAEEDEREERYNKKEDALIGRDQFMLDLQKYELEDQIVAFGGSPLHSKSPNPPENQPRDHQRRNGPSEKKGKLHEIRHNVRRRAKILFGDEDSDAKTAWVESEVQKRRMRWKTKTLSSADLEMPPDVMEITG